MHSPLRDQIRLSKATMQKDHYLNYSNLSLQLDGTISTTASGSIHARLMNTGYVFTNKFEKILDVS